MALSCRCEVPRACAPCSGIAAAAPLRFPDRARLGARGRVASSWRHSSCALIPHCSSAAKNLSPAHAHEPFHRPYSKKMFALSPPQMVAGYRFEAYEIKFHQGRNAGIPHGNTGGMQETKANNALGLGRIIVAGCQRCGSRQKTGSWQNFLHICRRNCHLSRSRLLAIAISSNRTLISISTHHHKAYLDTPPS